MKHIIPLLFAGIALTGCQEMAQSDPASLTPQEREALSTLEWLQKADPARDVESSAQRGDTQLYILAGRAQTPPGIPAETAEAAMTRCGTKLLPGSTDMVQGSLHLKLLQQARDYAADYNQRMLAKCLGSAD